MNRRLYVLYLLLLNSYVNYIKGVSGQTVSLSLISSTGTDSREGDAVRLQCIASNLQDGNVIEWARFETNRRIVARNGMSLDTRFSVKTTVLYSVTSKWERLVFTASKQDSGMYYCRVKVSELDSSGIVTLSSLPLSVLYFSAVMYHLCVPDGPTNVMEGALLNMYCTTEYGNPPVQINVPSIDGQPWMDSSSRTESIRSLGLRVNTNHSGQSVECRITSTAFPNRESSCTIGPITVVPSNPGPRSTQPTNLPSSQQKTLKPTPDISINAETQTPEYVPKSDTTFESTGGIRDRENTTYIPQNTLDLTGRPVASQLPIAALVAGVAGASSLLTLLLAVIMYQSYKRMTCLKKKSPEQQSPTRPTTDSYMPLQPMQDRGYTGLAPPHTYCQSLGVQNELSEQDYEQINATNREY